MDETDFVHDSNIPPPPPPPPLHSPGFTAGDPIPSGSFPWTFSSNGAEGILGPPFADVEGGPRCNAGEPG